MAKKSKKAKRGAPARKKKGMKKAKPAKRAKAKKRAPKPGQLHQSQLRSDGSIRASSGTAALGGMTEAQ